MRKGIIYSGLALSGAAAVILAMAGAASASATLDPGTGVGFVGKGDVQTPWLWSNATLQAQAGNVTFTFTSTDATDYDVTCTWNTGTDKHRVHHVRTTSKNEVVTVAYDITKTNRQNPKGMVTGFNLTGAGSSTTTQSGDPVPAQGDQCLGVDNQGQGMIGTISAVDVTSTVSNTTLDASDGSANTGPTSVWANGVSVLP